MLVFACNIHLAMNQISHTTKYISKSHLAYEQDGFMFAMAHLLFK